MYEVFRRCSDVTRSLGISCQKSEMTGKAGIPKWWHIISEDCLRETGLHTFVSGGAHDLINQNGGQEEVLGKHPRASSFCLNSSLL